MNIWDLNIQQGLFFVEIMVDYWKTCTKMGADKSAQNTQMPENLSAQIVCPSPIVWDFDEKRRS